MSTTMTTGTTYKFINEKLSQLEKALQDPSVSDAKKALLQVQKETLWGIHKLDSLFFNCHFELGCRDMASMFPELKVHLYAAHWNDCVMKMDKEIASMLKNAGIYKLTSSYLKDILTKAPDHSEDLIKNFFFMLNRELLYQAKRNTCIKRNMVKWMKKLPQIRNEEEVENSDS